MHSALTAAIDIPSRWQSRGSSTTSKCDAWSAGSSFTNCAPESGCKKLSGLRASRNSVRRERGSRVPCGLWFSVERSGWCHRRSAVLRSGPPARAGCQAGVHNKAPASVFPALAGADSAYGASSRGTLTLRSRSASIDLPSHFRAQGSNNTQTSEVSPD